MNDLTSIITNVKSFQDVQRALEELKKTLNSIKEKQNPSAEGGESQLDGEPGSVRVVENDSEEALFEIKTQEGWKRPIVGNTPVTFGEVKSISKTKTKRSIDEIEANDVETEGSVAKKTIFDEKANKFVLPRPDYDSGWIYMEDDSSNDLEHNLDISEPFSLHQIFISDVESPVIGTDTIVVNFEHHDGGAFIWYRDSNTITVTTDKKLFDDVGYGGTVPADIDNGYIRIKLWK